MGRAREWGQASLERLLRSPRIALAVTGIALGASFVVPWWEQDFYWDSAIFDVLAESLLDGEGYRYMGEPHAKYPPGLPLLLAGLKWSGLGVPGIHALMVGSAVIAVVLAFALLRDLHGRCFAFVACGLTLGTHAFLELQTHILSDLPYMALSLGALCAAGRMQREGSWSWAAITLALCVAALSVRSIGVVLAPAIVLGLLTGPRGAGAVPRLRLAAQSLVIGAVLVGLLGGWVLYGASVGVPEESIEAAPYHAELIREGSGGTPASGLPLVPEQLGRVLLNLWHYIWLTGMVMDGRGWVPGIVPGALVGVGLLLSLWRRRSLVDWYAACYGAVLCVWGAAEGRRFLLPLLPFLIDYLLCALAPWSVRTPDRRGGPDGSAADWPGGRPLASGIALLVVAVFVVLTNAESSFRTARDHARRPFYTPRVTEFREAVEWVRLNTPADLPIVTDRVPMVHQLTQRPVYQYALTRDSDRVLESLERHGQPIVIVNGLHDIPKFLTPLIEERPERFRELYRIGDHVVYQLTPPP